MHSRILRVAAVLIAVLFALGGAAAASASPRFSTPQELHRLGFEGGPSTGFTSVEAIPMPTDPIPTAAYWGLSNKASKTGTQSLWCAGTSTTSLPAAGFWPTYAAATRGKAVLSLPELGNYYTASMSFAYLLPSLGAADENAFGVRWTAKNSGFNYYGDSFPLTSSWTTVAYPLSREPGDLIFQFFDFNEGPAQTPAQGQGVAIDDLVVSGYMYGKVGQLTATPGAGTIQLNWDKPPASTTNSAADPRAIEYRVWRSPHGADAWTDLTASGRSTATDFTDSSTAPGASYDYAVQAWEPGTGDTGGYGQQATVTAADTRVKSQASLVTATAGALQHSWANFSVTGSVEPTHAAGKENVKIQAAFGSTSKIIATTWSGIAAADGVHYTASVRLSSVGTWYIRALHDDADHAATTSGWTKVTVSSAVLISKPSKPSSARLKKAFSVSGTLTPRHTSGSPVKIYAYRYSGSKIVQKLIVTPKITNASQPANTTKYYASIALPTKGSWKLRAYHAAHGVEGATWSSYTSAFSVK